jgi:acyl-CoA reductase-like NAD-dependent aldehyde dehydrogenase
MGLVVPEPLGVVGLIYPWNFPLAVGVLELCFTIGCTELRR